MPYLISANLTYYQIVENAIIRRSIEYDRRGFSAATFQIVGYIEPFNPAPIRPLHAIGGMANDDTCRCENCGNVIDIKPGEDCPMLCAECQIVFDEDLD